MINIKKLLTMPANNSQGLSDALSFITNQSHTLS